MIKDVDIYESKIIDGVVFIYPSFFEDLRGLLWTSFFHNQLDDYLPNGLSFIHDKFAVTKKNVLRGIHYDSKSWKLVTCVDGIVEQVVVDMREESSSFKKWEKKELCGDRPTMVLVPPRVGNAFYVKSSSAVYHYKLAYKGNYVDADEQKTVYWNDTSLGIDWSVKEPILSSRDKN